MAIIFFVGNIFVLFIVFLKYLLIRHVYFYNPFSFNKNKQIIKIETNMIETKQLEFYTPKTLKTLKIKHEILWMTLAIDIVLTLLVPILYTIIFFDFLLWVNISMFVSHFLFSIILVLSDIRYIKKFKASDAKIKKQLLGNNRNFHNVLEIEIDKVSKYVFDKDLNINNILSHRRIKLQFKYYLWKIRKTNNLIEKFVYIRAAILNNIQWSYTYKDPFNYTKYFEQQMYIRAGFLKI
ncbi:hypothetical protein EI74_0020 [Mycoplasma testudineum]|uniref:Uncharacterized protein n=1 Tax=Mycoplasma testudineum TaxID=244584 RepID=A0A4R6IJJ1_9MOLU|nr:hypothetical protein [Mycoplasma testudineum]OYD26461.1 hypothetical protein CG473_03925 [Mycoplasma testudineum]TDO22161.1 hypothetical protein EI74_0020 [Mycoplasma testudineum]